jgi:hypothetical protein
MIHRQTLKRSGCISIDERKEVEGGDGMRERMKLLVTFSSFLGIVV